MVARMVNIFYITLRNVISFSLCICAAISASYSLIKFESWLFFKGSRNLVVQENWTKLLLLSYDQWTQPPSAKGERVKEEKKKSKQIKKELVKRVM